MASVLDITRHGAWIVQHDQSGEVASKPPLYSWLAAPLVIATGREAEFLLKLPSLLAAMATVAMLWDLARRTVGPLPAAYAASFLVCSQLFSKHLYYVRTDMLLTAFVVMQFWAAVRFDSDPRQRWIWLFRLAGAAGLLTKGPIAILIPIISLLVWWWWRGILRARMREMGLVAGMVISLAPFAVWFAGALAVEGAAVYRQLVEAETIDRFVASSSKSKEHRHLLYYLPHFLGRMAPWSLLAVVALIFRRAREARLAVVWFAATLILLSLVLSKRADRLVPLLPAVCILGGLTFEKWFSARFSASGQTVDWEVKMTGGLVTASIAALGAAGVWILFRGAVELTVWLLGGVLILSATMSAIALLRENATSFFAALLTSLLAAIAAYQHLFSDWARAAAAS